MLRSLSVHADAAELHGWIDALPERPTTVYVVHGEPVASSALAGRLIEADINAVVPTRHEIVWLE